VILDDFRHARFEAIKHVMEFCPPDNLFIGCTAAQAVNFSLCFFISEISGVERGS
jgi:hypothetical protein